MKLLEEPDNIRCRFEGEIINVASNTIGAVPNVHLDSAPGGKSHPLILVTIDIYVGEVKIDRE